MPTMAEVNNLECGEALTIDYQKAIQEYFNEVLLDPYSAVIEYQGPEPYWFKELRYKGGDILAGYMVFVNVNAKNRMGGYTGKKTYGFLLKNNAIIRIITPEETLRTGIRYGKIFK